MPVHRQKKLTIANSPDSSEEQPVPGLPDQQEFRQHLRELARSVLEVVMREELDALIGVQWGESSPKRRGYRNGYYQRDLVTTTGRTVSAADSHVATCSYLLFFYESDLYYHCKRGSCNSRASHS